jgi:hypothetical protein
MYGWMGMGMNGWESNPAHIMPRASHEATSGLKGSAFSCHFILEADRVREEGFSRAQGTLTSL